MSKMTLAPLPPAPNETVPKWRQVQRAEIDDVRLVRVVEVTHACKSLAVGGGGKHDRLRAAIALGVLTSIAQVRRDVLGGRLEFEVQDRVGVLRSTDGGDDPQDQHHDHQLDQRKAAVGSRSRLWYVPYIDTSYLPWRTLLPRPNQPAGTT